MTLIQLAGFITPFVIAFIGMAYILITDVRKQEAYNARIEAEEAETAHAATITITHQHTEQTLRSRMELLGHDLRTLDTAAALMLARTGVDWDLWDCEVRGEAPMERNRA